MRANLHNGFKYFNSDGSHAYITILGSLKFSVCSGGDHQTKINIILNSHIQILIRQGFVFIYVIEYFLRK